MLLVMGSIRFLARCQRRRQILALVVLAVLAGTMGGAATSLLAGARRSSTVVDRFFDDAPHYEVLAYAPGLSREQVLAVPGVVRADPLGYVAMMRIDDAGRPIVGVAGLTVDFAAPADPTMRLLEGHFPDGSDTSHVLVNDPFQRQLRLGAGDDVTVRLFGLDQGPELERGIYEPDGPIYTFHIDGVARAPEDVAFEEVTQVRSESSYDRYANIAMLVSYDFWLLQHEEFLDFGAAFNVSLTAGPAGVEAFEATITGLVGDDGEPPGFEPPGTGGRRASFEAPVDLETTSLLALGVGLAVSGIAVVILLVRIGQRRHEREVPALRAVGFTSSQLATASAFRVVPAAAGAAALSVVVAVGLSGRYPIGFGRQLELDPGVHVDLLVILTGGIATGLAVLGSAFLAARPPRTRRATALRPTLARWLGRVGAPNGMALGAHLAFQTPDGRRSSTARQGVVGAALAVIVAVSVGTWLAGVDRLYSEPDRHGWPWDVAIGNSNFTLGPDRAAALAADPRLAAATLVTYGQATLGGESVEVMAFDPGGTAPPVVISGRLPVAPTEVALGGSWAAARTKLGTGIGSKIELSVAGGEFDHGSAGPPVELTVVGLALAPIFGESEVGDVAVVTLDAIAAAGGDATPSYLLARVDPTADPTSGSDSDAVIAQLRGELTEEMTTDIIPARVVNLHRVRSVPVLGLAVAALLGAVVIGSTLAAGVRTHRRELAILRALGLDRRGARHGSLWQGLLSWMVIVGVGVPVGLVAGVNLWRRTTDDLGVAPGAVTPVRYGLVTIGASALSVAVAVATTRRSRRTSLATLLHVG